MSSAWTWASAWTWYELSLRYGHKQGSTYVTTNLIQPPQSWCSSPSAGSVASYGDCWNTGGLFILLPWNKHQPLQRIKSDLCPLNPWCKFEWIHASRSGPGRRIGYSFHCCCWSWVQSTYLCPVSHTHTHTHGGRERLPFCSGMLQHELRPVGWHRPSLPVLLASAMLQ